MSSGAPNPAAPREGDLAVRAGAPMARRPPPLRMHLRPSRVRHY